MENLTSKISQTKNQTPLLLISQNPNPMKTLYRKTAVHPSPPPSSSETLSFLPAAILVLAASLSADDREVLAYLLSYSKGVNGAIDHSPAFNCNCFSCYMSFWVRWDSSPNRQMIHEIIDAFEGSVTRKTGNRGGRRERKRKGSIESEFSETDLASGEAAEGGGDGEGEEEERGSVRKIVSFIGEKIWSVLG